MIRSTSKEAYEEIQRKGLLATRHWQVYQTLFLYGPLTGAEVAIRVKEKHGEWCQSETIRNRLTELRDMGVVKEIGTRACSTNGRSVIEWAITDSLPHKREKRETTKQKIKRLEEEVHILRAKLRFFRENYKPKT